MAKRNAKLNKIIKNFLEEIQKKFEIDDAYLYGSFAKGTANKWSDIDIAIVSSDFSDDLFEDRLKLMRLASTIDDRLEPKPFTKELFSRTGILRCIQEKNPVRSRPIR